MNRIVSACALVSLVLLNAWTLSAETAANPSIQGESGESAPDYRSSRLVGIMKARGASVVVFENAKGEQTFFRVGETYSDGSKIVSVRVNSIVVRLQDGSHLECFVTPGAAKNTVSATAVETTATAVSATTSGQGIEKSAEVDPFKGKKITRERKRFKARDPGDEE